MKSKRSKEEAPESGAIAIRCQVCGFDSAAGNERPDSSAMHRRQKSNSLRQSVRSTQDASVFHRFKGRTFLDLMVDIVFALFCIKAL